MQTVETTTSSPNSTNAMLGAVILDEREKDIQKLCNAVYPLIDNHRWYAENGTVYNEADEEVRIVLLHA